MKGPCLIKKLIFYLCLLTASGCSTITPQSLQGLKATVCQTIIVSPIRKTAAQAFLSAWQKEGNRWHRKFYVSAVLGRNGLAAAGEKKEGDGKTPSGIYLLGPAFGYASSIDTGLSYRQATDNDFWVDDARSMQYNTWIRGTPLARSFERMKRPDDLYRYGIVIEYNTHPVMPGLGSAIFMHVWRGYNAPTSGCVALNQRNLRRILRWLDKNDQPVIVIE